MLFQLLRSVRWAWSGRRPPRHILGLSKLDTLFPKVTYVKFVLLFRKAPDVGDLRSSLSALLVPYYPLAGRLKESPDDVENGTTLVVDCTEEGVLFAEASMDATVDELLRVEGELGASWPKLLPSKELDKPILSIPLLIIQATSLKCGGMILCIASNHKLIDGCGLGQFIDGWAKLCRNPRSSTPLVQPCWGRETLFSPKGGVPTTQTQFKYRTPEPNPFMDEPLVPIMVTFEVDMIQKLRDQCLPKIDCTSFDVVTAHVWRCFVRAMFDPRSTGKWTTVGIPVNIRPRIDPPLPAGYYGNAVVSIVAECEIDRLISENISLAIRALQEAKASMQSADDYVQWFMHMAKWITLSNLPNLLVNQWSKLESQLVNFGCGRPVLLTGHGEHNHPLCLFLPMEVSKGVKVCITAPESRAPTLECYLKELGDTTTQNESQPSSEQLEGRASEFFVPNLQYLWRFPISSSCING